MGRIRFEQAQARATFFKESFENSQADSWKEFGAQKRVAKCMLEWYKTGKYLIPSELFERMLIELPKKRRSHYLNQTTENADDWGKKKGGSKTWTKHPEIFMRGRQIAIDTISTRPLKHDFDKNIQLDEDLCELIGAFIGDGFTNKYGSSYITQFTGHSKLDDMYYRETIIPIIKRLFGITPKVYKKKNIIRVNIYSKRLFEMLTDRFEVKPGVKVYTTKIPTEILQSNERLIFAAIRGVFDTDGCFFLDQRKIYKKPYPRITLQTASEPLYTQLKDILGKHFKLYTSKRKNKKHYVEIYGEDQLKKWYELIGFSNKRHRPQ